MALPDNAGEVKDSLCIYFAIYWQLIVDRKFLESPYSTNLEGHDMTVSPAYSRDRNAGQCAAGSVKYI
jgi:hypothetical protein